MLLGSALVATTVGCAYSRWNYVPIEKQLNHDFWVLHFGIVDYEFTLPASITKDHPDTSFFYIIELREEDTTKYPRLNFQVDNVQVSYSTKKEPTLLPKHLEGSKGEQHVGATAVTHTRYYGPFAVPKQRPDTILIEQDVTILYRDTGKALKHFHHTLKAALNKVRHSALREFIQGT